MFLLFAAATLTAAVWAVAALVGVVSAPPVVVIGGLIVTVLVALGAMATFRMIRGSSAAIDSLAAAAERIERGDYSTRVTESGPPPVRSLARAFNQMSARLAALESGRRTFLADVAHELRTPLSIIEGQIEAIEDGIYPADAAHLAPIHDQIRALEKLIDDMRTVALAEAGGLTLNLQPTDLWVLIDESLGGFKAQADGAGVSLHADRGGNLPLAMADEHRVRQILSNLISNALRHTPQDGTVTVSARFAASGWIEIEVADTGSGIAPELLPRIFDRFVKEPD
ncbi:MAG TPA: ATP-binding protein, partial [Candidatus Limnocylindrales bacterium]|nr:ATP-binding protein [Candidatus Limnocylindrales bacterium]